MYSCISVYLSTVIIWELGHRRSRGSNRSYLCPSSYCISPHACGAAAFRIRLEFNCVRAMVCGSSPSVALIWGEHRYERLLRDGDARVADRERGTLLALLLFLEQLLLPRDVATIALGKHVLARRLERLACDKAMRAVWFGESTPLSLAGWLARTPIAVRVGWCGGQKHGRHKPEGVPSAVRGMRRRARHAQARAACAGALGMCRRARHVQARSACAGALGMRRRARLGSRATTLLSTTAWMMTS